MRHVKENATFLVLKDVQNSVMAKSILICILMPILYQIQLYKYKNSMEISIK